MTKFRTGRRDAMNTMASTGIVGVAHARGRHVTGVAALPLIGQVSACAAHCCQNQFEQVSRGASLSMLASRLMMGYDEKEIAVLWDGDMLSWGGSTLSAPSVTTVRRLVYAASAGTEPAGGATMCPQVNAPTA